MKPANNTSCRKFESRKEGLAKYRSSGKPTFNPVPVCGPKPCPVVGQTRNSSGDCNCPPDQEEVNGKCVPKCDPATQKRNGDKCVSNCDLSKNELIDGQCLTKCEPNQKRVGLECVCDESKGFLTGKNGKCYKKVECEGLETPNADFTFCECKAPNRKNPSTGKCEPIPVMAKCDPTTQILNSKTNKCECAPGFKKDKSGNCVKDCDLSKNEMIGDKCLPKCKENEQRDERGKCFCPPATHDILKDGRCVEKCPGGQTRNEEGECETPIPEPQKIIPTILRTLYKDGDDIKASLMKDGIDSSFSDVIINDKKFQYFHRTNKKSWKRLALGPVINALTVYDNSTDVIQRSRLFDAIKETYAPSRGEEGEKYYMKLLFDLVVAYKSIYKIEDTITLKDKKGNPYDITGIHHIYNKVFGEIVKRFTYGLVSKKAQAVGMDPALYIISKINEYNKLTDVLKDKAVLISVADIKFYGGRRNTIKHRRRKTIKHRKLRNKKTIKRRSKKQNTRRK